MQIIKTLRERGFVAQITREDELTDALSKGPITLYVGFDPSADSLHVGHLLPIMAMGWMQRAGHKVIAVVGGGTGKIGDPTGKTEMRTMLSDAQIEANIAGIKTQLQRFLVLDGDKGELVNNAEWLMELKTIPFLREIGVHFSVNRMLAAEGYKQRLKRGLSFIEFNYQIMQAYDFLELYRRHGCTLQIGGDDQWGNIVAGTDLIRRATGGQGFGLTIPLLTTATGAKMGKTEKGAVWLDADKLSPFDYYQYWLNVADEDVGKLLRLYTILPITRIEELEALQGADIRMAKRELAYEATQLVHGAEAAESASLAAKAMVSGTAAADMPTYQVSTDQLTKGVHLVALLSEGGLTKSNSEGRRLIKGGGVKLNGQKVTDPNQPISTNDFNDGEAIIRVGKKRALRLTSS